MHELAITQSLLQIALDKARESGAKNIRCINLRIGRLTGYVPEAVEMNFGMLSPGTLAEGAKLLIQWVPVRISCKDCGKGSELGEFEMCCPNCGSTNVSITGGREMFIESMEIEDA
jgi:hydrogenase nickel incorporation protein HypA/HybF